MFTLRIYVITAVIGRINKMNIDDKITKKRFNTVALAITNLAKQTFGQDPSNISCEQTEGWGYRIDVEVPNNDQVDAFKAGLENLFTNVAVNYSFTGEGAEKKTLLVNGNIGEMALDLQGIDR